MSEEKYRRVRRLIYNDRGVKRWALYWLPEIYKLGDDEEIIEHAAIGTTERIGADPKPLPKYEGHSDGF